MKKILSLAFCLLFICGTAWAGGSCVASDFRIKNGAWKRLKATCTADAADATMVHIFDITTDAGKKVMDFMAGYRIYTITQYDTAGTDMSDNSDLEIKDSRGKILLSASNNGENFVTATGDPTEVYTDIAGATNHYQLIHGDYQLTFTITGNSINSGVTVIEIDLGRGE